MEGGAAADGRLNDQSRTAGKPNGIGPGGGRHRHGGPAAHVPGSRSGERRGPVMSPRFVGADTAAALERAAVAVGRLDDALAGHPLRPGWTHWAGLEAACRHAAADGWKADPYRLAAFVQGLPLRAVGTSAAERGRGHDAVAQAFARRSWLACPDADQAALLAHAEDHLARGGSRCPALLGAAWGMHGWLAGRGSRDAVRAAVPRHLHRRGLTRGVLPALTGNDALKPDPDDRIDDPDAFARRFLAGVAREAEAGRDRLRAMEYAWREGRGTVEARAGKRST